MKEKGSTTNLLKPLVRTSERSNQLRKAIRCSRSNTLETTRIEPTPNKQKQSERDIFHRFAEATSFLLVDADSIDSRDPPEPDVWCTVSLVPYYFELASITEPKMAIAENSSPSSPKGGAYSNDAALLAIMKKKAHKKYSVDGIRVDLLLYYYEQPAPPEEELSKFLPIHKTVVEALTVGGPFSRVWIFDVWNTRVLYQSRRVEHD